MTAARQPHGLGSFGDTIRRGLHSAREQSVTFREFLTSPEFCGVKPSPVISAIVDASEGREVHTIDDATASAYFGCDRSRIPRHPYRVVIVSAGGRGGKTSRLLAPKALHAAWTVRTPDLARGEEAYAIIAAPSMALARQTYAFCRGYVESSPVLSKAIVDRPLAESLTLRRPDGQRVTLQVFAASRGGAQLRARTLVFAGFDEAAFFRDAASGAVNDTDLFHAVFPRVVEGGAVWLVSTPWIARVGLMEAKLSRDHGTHVDALCVSRVPTRALRPTWDPTGEIERAARAEDPDRAAREIDAIPLAEGTAQFFADAAIDAAVNDARPVDLPRERERFYAAGGDAGFRRNSSTLAIVTTDGEGERVRVRLALLRELKPETGVPLNPSGVVASFARDLATYGCGTLACDSHERDAVNIELARHGMSAVPTPEGQHGKADAYVLARKLLHEGRLELPRHPRLIRQLRDVVAKPMPGGGMSITSPVRIDGSHGDLVSALVAAVWAAAGTEVSRAAFDHRGYDAIPENYGPE